MVSSVLLLIEEDLTDTPSCRSDAKKACHSSSGMRLRYKPRFFSVTLTPPPCW